MEQKPLTLEVVRSVIQLLGRKEAEVEVELEGGQCAFLVLSEPNGDKEMTFRTFAETGKLLYAKFPYYDLTQNDRNLGIYMWVVLFSPEAEVESTEVKAVNGFNFIANFLTTYVHAPKPKIETYTALKLAFIGLLQLLHLPSSENELYKERLRKLYKNAHAYGGRFAGGMANMRTQSEFWRGSEMSDAESTAIAKKFNGGGGDELPDRDVYENHFLPYRSLRKMVTDADLVFITSKAPQDSDSRDDLKLVVHKPRLSPLEDAKFEFKPFDGKTKLD